MYSRNCCGAATRRRDDDVVSDDRNVHADGYPVSGLDVDHRPGLGDGLRDAVGDAAILIVRGAEVKADAIEAAKGLHLIVRAGAGVTTLGWIVSLAFGIVWFLRANPSTMAP